MIRRVRSVHTGGDPLPSSEDIVAQTGPGGLGLADLRNGGELFTTDPVDLAEMR